MLALNLTALKRNWYLYSNPGTMSQYFGNECTARRLWYKHNGIVESDVPFKAKTYRIPHLFFMYSAVCCKEEKKKWKIKNALLSCLYSRLNIYSSHIFWKGDIHRKEANTGDCDKNFLTCTETWLWKVTQILERLKRDILCLCSAHGVLCIISGY